MRRIALLAAACSAGAAFSGCSTVTPVAAPVMAVTGFSYSVGRSTQDFAVASDKLQPAVLGAMDDLRIHSVQQSAEPGAMYFQGTTADDRRAVVTLRPYAGGTRVTSRIGLMGDEPLSRALMDRTGIRLGTLPPAPIPETVPSKPGTLLGPNGPDPNYLHDEVERRFYDQTKP